MTAWASSSSKVPLSCASLAWTLNHQSVLASGCSKSKLVKSDNFTSSFQDPLASLLSDPQGADGHLGDFEDPGVVGDGSNTDNVLSAFPGFFMLRTRRAMDRGGLLI